MKVSKITSLPLAYLLMVLESIEDRGLQSSSMSRAQLVHND